MNLQFTTFLWLVLPLVLQGACSNPTLEQTSSAIAADESATVAEANTSPPEEEQAEETIQLPTEITGAYLTAENAKIRCIFRKLPETATSFDISCNAVTEQNGKEIIPTAVARGTKASWMPLDLKRGEAELSPCAIGAENLSMVCNVSSVENLADLEVSLEVESEESKRQVKT